MTRTYEHALIKPVNKADDLRLRMFTSGAFKYEDKKAELPNITAQDVEVRFHSESKLPNIEFPKLERIDAYI